MTREQLREDIEKEYIRLNKKYEETRSKEDFDARNRLYEKAKFLRFNIVRNFNEDYTLAHCMVVDEN